MRLFWLNDCLHLGPESYEDRYILDSFQKMLETIKVGPAPEVMTGPIVTVQADDDQSDEPFEEPFTESIMVTRKRGCKRIP